MKVKINLLRFFASVLKIFITALKDSFAMTPHKCISEINFILSESTKIYLFLNGYNFSKQAAQNGICFAVLAPFSKES